MNVNSLLEGASPLQHQQAESAKLANKWEKSGLLEGLDGHESEKANMSVLLENQARQLVNEANSLGASGGGTSISTGGSEAWAGVALPLVRRVFGEIVAKDLVSVQPMNLPSGLIFYLDFQYGSAQSSFSVGDSLSAATSDKTKTSLPAVGQGNGLYGAGRFGYSINDADSVALYITGGVAGDIDVMTPNATSASHAALTVNDSASVNFDDEFLASVTLTNVDQIRVYAGTKSATGALPDFDPEGIRAFEVLNDTTAVTVYNQFTTYNASTGMLDIFVDNSAQTFASGDADLVIRYQKGPDNLNDRGDFEESTASAPGGNLSDLDIPSIDVKLNSDTVTAKTRKLKAQWTPEFAQDLNAYHSIDAEAELTSILSEYISMEIDLEILDMLIRNADTTNHWSAKVGDEASSTGVVTTATNNEYYTKMSWFQTLGVKLQSVSNTIHQKTLRGGANFMVVSPKVSTILESIPGFAADSPGDSNKYAMGVQKIGAINSRYTVYKNPYMTENVILMGYKGNQFLETGAVFAPYIPLIMTPLVYDPVSFTPRKGIMTRYAKKMVRPDFYGKVFIHDLNLV
ncbi:hypothetical protein OAA40_00440 [bacterium]|nr:hypothetical protein [bacterium]MDB4346187.1 hypothetical protein [bacterium]